MLGQAVDWDMQWGQVVGRAWADDAFKQRLLAEPATTLQEYGLTPPAGRRIEIVEGAASTEGGETIRLVLPAKPGAEELSEDELSSTGDDAAVMRCGWCRCERCHRCEWCGGCYQTTPPEID